MVGLLDRVLRAIIPLFGASQVIFYPQSSEVHESIYVSPGPIQGGHGAIHLSSQWSVVGPFPAGMREHQMGAFPPLTMYDLPTLFNTTNPVELPSTYGKAGVVWAKEVISQFYPCHSHSRASQTVRISYPELDWSQMRQSMGWSGMQWQALSVADLSVQADSTLAASFNLDSGAEFAVLTEDEYRSYSWDQLYLPARWYNGDWYGYNREGLSVRSNVPAHVVRLQSGKYKVLVKAVYEIRVFGDKSDGIPQLEFGVDVRILDGEAVSAITAAPFGVAPDVLDGQIAGWGVSFALCNEQEEWAEVVGAKVKGEGERHLSIRASDLPLRLAPLQTRPVKLELEGRSSLPQSVTVLEVEVSIRLLSSASTTTVHVALPLHHVQLEVKEGPSSEAVAFKYTYLDPDQTVQYAVAVPPRNMTARGSNDRRPAIVYLHGAGVDVRFREAQSSLLRQEESWVILPMGRSGWGYDWQTLSQSSASTALSAFSLYMYGLTEQARKGAAQIDTDKVMIIGHSNGGQGVFHFGSHRPDQVIGAVAGAGYMSLAEYVPLTWQLGRHFTDGVLAGILRSSLSAFENDLFASNLAGLPLLIKYGADDDNVPTWHSREMASLVSNWNREGRAGRELVQLSEVPNRSHYWPEFMRETDVQSTIDSRVLYALNPHYHMPLPLDRFTLTVLNPEDSGSKQGWSITQVETPGRLARLEVEYTAAAGMVRVQTRHVRQVQVRLAAAVRDSAQLHIHIDGTVLGKEVVRAASNGVLSLIKSSSGWEVAGRGKVGRPIGPMIRFLSSSGPIQVIVPTDCPAHVTRRYLSLARRFATDAYLYGRLDAVILRDYEVVGAGKATAIGLSNVLLLGGPTINAVSRLSTRSQHLVHFLDSSLQFRIEDRVFDSGSALLAMVPHPLATQASREKSGNNDGALLPMALLLHGTDDLAIERGYSLLPVRTGTLLPEWIVVDRSSMWKGYGGVVGAGWYDEAWSWSQAMSYLA